MSDLKAGDVVVLKSGGPKMTVGSADYNVVSCYWFAGTDVKEKTFPGEALELAKEATGDKGSLASRLA